MWEADGMAQEKREDENRAGTEQPGDASPAATPAKKTVRRVVRQTAPQKPRVTLGRGLTSGEEQRQSQRHQSQQRQSRQQQSQQQPRRPHRSRSSSKTKTTFSTVSAASTRLAQRARIATGDAAGATRSRMDRARWALVNTTPKPAAAALAGLVSGLLTVLVGWGFSHLFSWMRGTSTGGQAWGKSTVPAMLIIAFAAGRRLMRSLHVTHSSLTSLTGICVSLAVTLAFLPDLVTGARVSPLMPALAAVSLPVRQA